MMDSVLRECRKNEKNSLILRCKTGITRLELDKLKSCEVTGRNLLLHKEDGEVLDSVGKLDDLCEQLKDYECFVRCHRSYMINMDYVGRYPDPDSAWKIFGTERQIFFLFLS